MLKELGVGGLLLTAVWRGAHGAAEVPDNVHGLVYLETTHAGHDEDI